MVPRPVVFLTLAFISSGAAFAVVTPMFQNPDEATHLDMARHYAYETTDLAGPDLRVSPSVRAAVEMVGLLEGHYLGYERVPDRRPLYPELTALPGPGQRWGCAVSSPTCQNYQYAHPPGFYLALAPAVWLLEKAGVGFPTELLVIRLVAVLLAAPVVALTWYAARQVWPRSDVMGVAAAAFVALAGPVVANAAMVNNDSLVLLLAAVSIALTARMLRAGATVRLAIALGALVAAGLLVKAPFLPLAAVFGVAVLVAPSRERRRERWAAAVNRVRVTAAYAAPVAVGMAWWVRNLVRDRSITPAGSEILLEERQGPWSDESFLSYVVDHLPTLVSRAWGNYGWRTVEVPPAWRWVLSVGLLVLVGAWLAARRWRRPTPAGLRLGLVLAAVPVSLALAALWASFEVFVSTGEEARGLVGRYVYPSAPVLALGAVGALAAVGRRAQLPPTVRRGALAAGVVAWGGLATVGSFVLAARGLYRTGDVGLLLERATVVAPVPSVVPFLVVAAAIWGLAVGATAWCAWRSQTT